MSFFKINISLVILSLSCANAAIPENTNKAQAFEQSYLEAKSSSQPMSRRWKALMRAAELAQGEQLNKIAEFRKDKDWYMRNAMLVAFDKSGNNSVYDHAKILIQDKALVVRSASADILMRLNNQEVRRIFSQEMDKSYNFKGRSSLWIRPQMMKYLAANPSQTERSFFVKYLYDKDIKVASLSAEALEKITQIRFSGKDSADLVNKWKEAARTQKW